MRPPRPPRTLLVPVAVVFAITSIATAAGAATPGAAPEAASVKKPNVVFILTDDLDLTSYLDPSRFPMVNSLLVDKGTTFSNYFVTDSLCCPSRSSTLRGQYVHEHGVLGNLAPDGGYEKFHANGDETSTIATWLHDDGYRTGLLGKYLNGYPATVAPTFVPPGWDEWDSPTSGGNPYSEYNYRLNENGKLVRYGSSPQDYLVDVLSRKSGEFIQQKSDKPFFLYVAPYVPHLPATPAPRYADAFPGVQAPRTPSFNQTDLSAEPQWLQKRPLLDDQQIGAIDQVYRRRLQSMLGVEDLVANVVDTLKRTGQLDNTYIVFSSDNGFHLGQHRLPPGKQTAFEEDIHVPLIVRGPGVPQGKKVDDFAMNIDLAPTFADLAGAKTPGFVNGRSLVPEMHGRRPDAERSAVLIEHYAHAGRRQRQRQRQQNVRATAQRDPDNDTNPPDAGTPTAGPQAPVLRQGQFQAVAIPDYAALRTDRYTYVEYSTGERELYDLRADPDQLHNIAGTADPKIVRDLSRRLAALKSCKGHACRTADRG